MSAPNSTDLQSCLQDGDYNAYPICRQFITDLDTTRRIFTAFIPPLVNLIGTCISLSVGMVFLSVKAGGDSDFKWFTFAFIAGNIARNVSRGLFNIFGIRPPQSGTESLTFLSIRLARPLVYSLGLHCSILHFCTGLYVLCGSHRMPRALLYFCQASRYHLGVVTMLSIPTTLIPQYLLGEYHESLCCKKDAGLAKDLVINVSAFLQTMNYTTSFVSEIFYVLSLLLTLACYIRPNACRQTVICNTMAPCSKHFLQKFTILNVLMCIEIGLQTYCEKGIAERRELTSLSFSAFFKFQEVNLLFLFCQYLVILFDAFYGLALLFLYVREPCRPSAWQELMVPSLSQPLTEEHFALPSQKEDEEVCI